MDGPGGSAPDIEFLDDAVGKSDKLELRLWLRMLSTTRLISQELRRRLRAEFGSTLPQFDLLAQLYRERGGLRLGELSKRAMVTNGSITGLVERLEKDGFVVREALQDDRRVTIARLTRRGLSHFSAMAKAHELWLKEIMADVERSAVKQLIADVSRIKQSAGNHLSGNDDE